MSRPIPQPRCAALLSTEGMVYHEDPTPRQCSNRAAAIVDARRTRTGAVIPTPLCKRHQHTAERYGYVRAVPILIAGLRPHAPERRQWYA